MSFRTLITTTISSVLALLLAGTASAQNAGTTSDKGENISLYGVFDAGVEYLSGAATGSGQDASLVRLNSGTATAGSRLGIRGSENLGNGLKTLVTLEAGFGPDTGASMQGGRLFGRQAYVGLSGDFGTVTFGRQYSMLFFGLLDTDLQGPNAHGLGSVDARITNMRDDNVIAYRGTFGRFTGGANFSLGRDATNCPGESAASKTQCREWSLLAKYDHGPWGIVSAYERLYGGTATTPGGLTAPDRTDSRLMFSGFVNVASSKFAAGLIKRNNKGSTTTPKSDMFWLAAATPVTPTFTVDGALIHIRFDNSPNKANMISLRGTYSFSKRTATYLSTGYINNSGNAALSVSSGQLGGTPLPGESQLGLMVGLRHAF